MEELGRKKTIVSALVLHYSSGFLRRPQKYGLTFLKVLTLLGIVKSNGKIEQKFMAFSEYMNFTKMYPTPFKTICLIYEYEC